MVPPRRRASAAASKRRLWLLLPLVVFLALAVLFAFRLNSGDPSRVPSALLNKPVPEFTLPPIEAADGQACRAPTFERRPSGERLGVVVCAVPA